MSGPAYREFYYPLNVFMHILTHEEGSVDYLHYGLFEREDEPIGAAQERSTELLLSRLPPPPARLLEVGIGLATTLDRLVKMGYHVEGITPDEKQIAMARARYGEAIPVHHVSFETFDSGTTYDAIVFQESSQYIDSKTLFTRARGLAPLVIVLDEFAMTPLDPPGLHSFPEFMDAATANGFSAVEELDLSAKAAPTVSYFMKRLETWRSRLIADLALTDHQVDELIVSGEKYRARYEDRTYAYKLVVLSSRA